LEFKEKYLKVKKYFVVRIKESTRQTRVCRAPELKRTAKYFFKRMTFGLFGVRRGRKILCRAL
jgi:hypothetical protein